MTVNEQTTTDHGTPQVVLVDPRTLILEVNVRADADLNTGLIHLDEFRAGPLHDHQTGA